MKKLSLKIIEKLLLWLIGWAMIIDGVVIVVSMGLVRIHLALRMAKALAKWRTKRMVYQLIDLA